MPDLEGIARLTYSAKSLLITGAGGSVGSHLVAELSRFAPLKIAALDKDENAVRELQQELRLKRPPATSVELHIADVRDAGRLGDICREFSPQVVFHLAAYNDVSLMEAHPFEAVLTNVVGTMNLLDVAGGLGAERLLFVSTNEAVNPASVMGATKRIGELLVCASAKSGRIRTGSVRLGHVLGSRCGIVARQQRQIANGGPVTVAHREIVRNFITMKQAIDLLLSAGCEAQNGEIYFSELGRPINVYELAREIIFLSGKEQGKEIEIEITGLCPGERLTEELKAPFERRMKTQFAGLSFVEPPELDERRLMSQIARLVQSARNADRNGVYAVLSSMGLGFQRTPQTTVLKAEPAELPRDEPHQQPAPMQRPNGPGRWAKGAASGG